MAPDTEANHPTKNASTERALRRCGALLLLILLCFPLGCAVSASSGVSSSEQAAQAATSVAAVTPQFFGMVVKGVHQPTVSTGSRRLWDTGVTWAALEPAAGSFSWSPLDAEVAAAQAQGDEITLTLGMTPTWASSEPALASAYGAGATAMPVNLSDWDAYVTAVATRYQGRIASYEVWNDPSDASYWSGASAQVGSDMATLSAHAAADLQAADPKAILVSPALDSAGLQQFLAAGGSASVQAIGVALSTAGEAPEAVTGEISAIRSALANTSAEAKPLWNDQPSWTLPSAGLSEQDQAAYVARALVLNASYGVSRLSWYAWDDTAATALQLTDANSQPTPAGTAYGVVEGWLNGTMINGCSANAEQVWTCQLVRGGQPGWILWSPNGTVQTSGLGMTILSNVDGSEEAVGQGGSVTVGPSPVLLQ